MRDDAVTHRSRSAKENREGGKSRDEDASNLMASLSCSNESEAVSTPSMMTCPDTRWGSIARKRARRREDLPEPVLANGKNRGVQSRRRGREKEQGGGGPSADTNLESGREGEGEIVEGEGQVVSERRGRERSVLRPEGIVRGQTNLYFIE